MSKDAETFDQPIIAQPKPFEIELKASYRYAWCACGLSGHQPFCDGSHTRTGGKFKPVVWTAEKSETVLLCGCKRTGDKPFCDSTHNSL